MSSVEAGNKPLSAAQDYYTPQYWELFEKCLQYRIGEALWKPFNFIKIFKLGLHWVVLFRALDETGNAKLTYWVMTTWDGALTQAGTLANTLRRIFASAYARTN